jgi:glycosyltransferase involved in cell wall biosynthesis
VPRPERVLLLHNRYRAAGGEERVVDELEALLSARGHAVARCERDSGASGRVAAARALLRGGVAEDEVAAAVAAHRADVLHAHNVHPLFGWRALAAGRAAGARVVLHLHNYRFACAIGVAYRDGGPCHSCRGRDTRPGLRHRCRGSLPEATVYATALAAQQPRLLDLVDRFVAVGEAQAAILEGFGVPRARTDVVSNAVAVVAGQSRAQTGRYALAAGRLVEEKGFDMAIAAARGARVPLLIAGEGPDEPRLRALAAGADVEFLGQLDGGRLAQVRGEAAVVLVPSRWEEACPMAAVEALADGVPVLASDLGGLPELVGSEAVLPARDERAWARALRALWDDPPLRARRGEEALARARARHTPDAQYAALRTAYAAAERAAAARSAGGAEAGGRAAGGEAAGGGAEAGGRAAGGDAVGGGAEAGG